MTSGTRQVPAGLPWIVTSGERDPETVGRLLRLLPDWFGIESSIVRYVEQAHDLPTYLAWPGAGSQLRDRDRQAVGVLLAARHFPAAAEIHLMAVDPAMRRRGIGRGLVQALEADLIADGVELLQVKTLGPSRPDASYDQTRQFYTRMGFRPLEEIHGLWPGNPCLVMVNSLQQDHAHRTARSGR
jgi:GNAT superfamily N-acetyltransferase